MSNIQLILPILHSHIPILIPVKYGVWKLRQD